MSDEGDTAGVGRTAHHHVIRDGSNWLCLICRGTWPYPSPLPPDTAGTCVPRPLGAG